MGRTRRDLGAAALAIVAALAGGGCATGTQPPAALAANAEARVKVAEAALDAAPLDAARAREAARARFEAGEFGRAHALFLAAIALVDRPAYPAGAAGAPAAPSRADLEREARDAERAGRRGAGPGGTGAGQERHARGRDEALRLYREKEYAKALERLEKLPGESDPRVPRWIAACRLKLAGAATDEGRFREGIDHLWRAADADELARTEALYRDVARVERRLAVELAARGDPAGALASLRHAFRAAPRDPETLYLLLRHRAVPAYERSYYDGLIRVYHPRAAETEFLEAAAKVRAAPDVGAAAAVADAFAAKHAGEAVLLADLRAMVADRSSGDAVRDAAAARSRYQAALEDARKSRTAFEAGVTPAAEPAPPAPEEPEDR